MKLRHIFQVAALLAVCNSLQAKVTLPSVISDNMVLQQHSNAAIWGTAEPGRKVSVKTSWNNGMTMTTADQKTGKWQVRVSTPEAGGPYEITVSDGDKVTLHNILIGEVWFASGQSNMEMPVKGYPASPVEGSVDMIVSADPSRDLRICSISHQSSVAASESTVGSWEKYSPDIVANTSATACFFADALQKALNIPVGVIVSCWGGSSIQTWMTREALAEKFPEVDLGSVDGKHPVDNEYQDACLLYNGMVAPLVPYTFKGMIWYQGETNREHPDQYIRLQTEYVRMMRELFEVPDAPFYYVQIAPWTYDEPDSFLSGYFYEAQAKCLKTIPSSGMVTTCDIGDYSNIHPSHKREVGQRLALLALQRDYGFDSVLAEAPTFESVVFKDGKACLSFNVDNLYLAPLNTPLIGFEIAGEDKVFHKAEAVIDRSCYSRVIVWSSMVPAPSAVRYCFRNWCEGSLSNNFGVPASPFRTDDWPL